MARKRKNNHGVPRAKRMKRSARLHSAVSWLKKYEGKNVLRGYCKHFEVDWRCAAMELRQLAVQLDPDDLNRREQFEGQVAKQRKRRREARAGKDSLPDPFEYESLLDAYLAKNFAALHAMECERDGIDPETGRAVHVKSAQLQRAVRRNRD